MQAGTIAYGREKALGWLKILDQNLIGPRNNFLCGDSVTIADYLGAIMVVGRRSRSARISTPIPTSRAGSAT